MNLFLLERVPLLVHSVHDFVNTAGGILFGLNMPTGHPDEERKKTKRKKEGTNL